MPSTFNIEIDSSYPAEKVLPLLQHAGFALESGVDRPDARVAFFPSSDAPVYVSRTNETIREYEPNLGIWSVGTRIRLMPSVASVDEDMDLVRRVVERLSEEVGVRFALSFMYETLYAYRIDDKVVWLRSLND